MGTIAYGDAISWSSINEDTFFTEGGLKYATNLTEIPQDVQSLESSVVLDDGVDFDLKSTQFSAEKTAKELQNMFATPTSSYARYFRYRQNALEQLWLKREEFKNSKTKSEQGKIRARSPAVVAMGKPRIDFSSRVSLLLLIPLIKSHSKTDPTLAEHSAQVLFQCLKESMPNSLGDEPLSSVTGLADLLTDWLVCQDDEVALSISDDENALLIEQEKKEPKEVLVQSETVVGCLLSLACARLVISNLSKGYEFISRINVMELAFVI